VFLQRLFSTFANGLPGMGLLLQRLITGSLLVHYALVHLREPTAFVTLLTQLLRLGAGILLMIGLWTPVVGGVIGMVELSGLFFGLGNHLNALVLATQGASLALIGPGAWSIDARIFGRKQISVSSAEIERFRLKSGQ
jgi:uncharacterized membrane protein YphA (DoxX/SURF4 family)